MSLQKYLRRLGENGKIKKDIKIKQKKGEKNERNK